MEQFRLDESQTEGVSKHTRSFRRSKCKWPLNENLVKKFIKSQFIKPPTDLWTGLVNKKFKLQLKGHRPHRCFCGYISFKVGRQKRGLSNVCHCNLKFIRCQL